MKRYRCKKSFVVDSYDDDGFLIENKEKLIEVGQMYELNKTGSTIIGGDVHLDNADGSWLEITKEHLQEFFEEVDDLTRQNYGERIMGEIKRLPEAEEMVMAIVWSFGEAPDLVKVRATANRIYGRDWKLQTVSTFLCRLVKKGYLTSERNGRSYYYTAKVSMEDYCESQIRHMAKMFFDGDLQWIGNLAGV